MIFGRNSFDLKTSLKPIRFAGIYHPLPQMLEALANRYCFASLSLRGAGSKQENIL
jgi:hypothetical protein